MNQEEGEDTNQAQEIDQSDREASLEGMVKQLDLAISHKVCSLIREIIIDPMLLQEHKIRVSEPLVKGKEEQ